MSVIGLSLLVASLSFFCYRCPPSSWHFLRWLRRPSLAFRSKKPFNDAPPTLKLSEPEQKAEEEENSHNGTAGSVSNPNMEKDEPTKQDLDRRAMPPPPPPFKRPLQTTQQPSSPPTTQPDSPPTPRAPSLSLSSEAEPSVPSFPALNSAQRASGGFSGPPRLNPVQPFPSAGLMPPPLRSPLPNRGPPTPSSSLLPPPVHTSVPTKPRRKVLLTPGHSPLDWARLSSSPTSNLSGLPPGTPYLRVPPSLLKQMTGRKGKDAWTVLGGKVYNITPYAPYHPGGEPELLKAAGRDGTRLFGEVHPWVNWEGMLEGCLVGVAVDESEAQSVGKWEEMD